MLWQKSSYSNGSGCVEIAIPMKSSYSYNNGCVEIAIPMKSNYSVNYNCVEVAVPRKSKHSGDNGCVEVGEFKKSPHSTTNGCVEVERGPMILVRDSKDKTGDAAILQFTAEAWELEVLDPIKRGDFNWNTFLPLLFDDEERDAFIRGVLDGEFDLEKV